ncbi:MAG: tetratricopeptide repeat protein [Desulfobaccales bacterium]
MDEAANVGPLLQRLVDGTATDADSQTLKEALAAGRLSLATGARAAAITGDVTDTVIVTGDRNFVFKGGDAAALRQAFLALYPARLRQLPADLPDFTGREPEVEKLLHLFLDSSGQAPISALGGMGGVGKTALAVHLAHKLEVHYPEAQIFVDLAGTAAVPLSPAAAMGRVITAFEPQARLPESPDEVAALFRSHLAGRQALLLLDNAASAAQVRDLLPPPPAAAIFTSRRAIILPGLIFLNLDVLSAEEAADLVHTILGKGRATDAEIAALAGHCGRLPLALRAAGSFLATHPDWGVGEYLEALVQEKERLRRLKQEDLEVEAVLGLSAAGLGRGNPEWAGRWQGLTIFPGSFDRAGAAAVWEVEVKEARDTLNELLIRSLVLYDSATGRYRLHDLMRLVAVNAFGYGGAVPDGAADAQRLAQAAARHASHYVKILREAGDLCERGGEALGQGLKLFDREWDNLRAGQKWAEDQAGVDESAAELCNAYPDAGVYLLSLRQHPRERLRWLEAALAAARRLQDRGAEGAHLGSLGLAHHFLGEYRRAIEYHEQHLAIAREIGDRRGEGNALGSLGLAYHFLGEYRRAIEYHEQALAIAREIGDRQGEGNALGNLGLAYYSLGEYRRAIEYHEQDLAIAREIGDRQGEGNARWNMSLALNELGQRQSAIAQAQEALKIYEQIESPFADEVRRQLAAWRQESSPSEAPDQPSKRP